MSAANLVVDFYEARGPRWEETLCHRVELELAEGRRVYVWASSETQARRLDELLWTFRDDSFVPHALWRGEGDLEEVVAVGWRPGNPNRADCLVLARDAVPAELAGYARAVDFAAVDVGELRDAARLRFRAFRDAGLAVAFHAAP